MRRRAEAALETIAAVWTTVSQPSAAFCHGPASPTSPATVPASGSAATSTPRTVTSSSRRRAASERPMKPEAPVISAVLTRRLPYLP